MQMFAQKITPSKNGQILPTIGLIATTSGGELIEYCKQIQILSNAKLGRNLLCDIIGYSAIINGNVDDNGDFEDILHLNDIYSYSVRNCKAIFLCNPYLEYLWAEIQFPKPFTIESKDSVVTAIKKYSPRGWAVFTDIITTELGLILSHLRENDIEVRLFSKEDIDYFKSVRRNGCVNGNIEDGELEMLNYKLMQLNKYGIGGIIVYHKVLFDILQRLSLDLPVIYVRDVHVDAIVEFLHSNFKS